ncbi:stage II sporulation protein E [Natronobacillus azotifigens]|uniref:Stage II sporulation protein E n=1 Tax=Natronobacillus azotifigens TaxID=472978 RepID=A0A9J6RDN1_9BACI|nr:stage II sporulation protein E [Natronobacillus azotifigens]MCZ0703581.1 stage II sporulation protein E [Natronobacillus azotifigens]
MLDTVSEVKDMKLSGLKLNNLQGKWAEKLRLLFMDKGLFLYLIAFLLGRAVILEVLSPFSLAFLASVWFVQKRKSNPTIVFSVVGALTVGPLHSLYVVMAALIFVLFTMIGKGVNQQKQLPFLVFFASLIPRAVYYTLFQQWTIYEGAMAVTEAILSAVLVLIFMQSIPLLSPKRYKPALKNEEIISFIILVASVLSGMVGWQIQGVFVDQVVARYLVILFAYIGGATMGSTVGVVIGLIISLANGATLTQMSLLAFGGLLGGLLKEANKLGVGFGLFVGTMLLGIYGGGSEPLFPSILQSLFAIAFLFCTPKVWINRLARYIPGTSEHALEQQKYLQKVRDVTANRMEQFSGVFQALSQSFTGKMPELHEKNNQEKETDYFLSNVTERTCQTCFKKDWCWARHFDETYEQMTSLKEDLEKGSVPNKALQTKFANHCVKAKKVEEVMREELSYYEANQQLKKQVGESRRFVADQLLGVSEVMENFAKEIANERESHEQQEAEVIAALKSIGMEIEQLDIYCLRKGEIDIEMTLSVYQYHGEGEKVIAPILSDILKETIVVKEEEVSPMPNGYCYLIFHSAKKYELSIGVAHAALGGGFISGDSYSTMELSSGKYALAISDGMGNGKRAREESMETLRLLQQILQSGIAEQVAIKSINSILSLRTNDEIFSTLDLAMVDLQTAHVQFLKIGSTPSFVKRFNQVHMIESSNLPIGIIKDFDVDVVDEQLKDGDILIMTSDGIFEGPKHIENPDLWLKRQIKNFATDDPQEIADLLLEEVVRATAGKIEDDMTILVAKIDKYKAKWANVPLYHKQAN